MKKVLFVVPEYPPGLTVGSARTLAFEKYLPDFDFQTCVLTVRSSGALPTDREKRVYRAPDLGMLYLPITRRLLPTSRFYVDSSYPRDRQSLDQKRSWITILLGRVRQIALGLLVPDLQITWLPGAIWLGQRVLQLEKPALIYSSSPPESAHLIAGRLARQSSLPWVADFRDGWLFEPLKPSLRTEGWRRRVEGMLERYVVRQASAVVSVSEPISTYFRSTYLQEPPKKFLTIPNGYDADDWLSVKPVLRDASRLRLVHTGSFSLSRATSSPDELLRALARLSKETRDSLEIVFVGKLSEAEQMLLAKSNLADCVRWVGPLSRHESLGYQLSADGLLLIAGLDKSVATSKLFEYLYVGRPILALAALESAAAHIVLETGAGDVVSPADIDGITAILQRWVDRWRSGRLHVKPRGIERYDRRVTARQLADLFQRLLSITKQ